MFTAVLGGACVGFVKLLESFDGGGGGGDDKDDESGGILLTLGGRNVIERDAGLEIPRIFATKGEVWFRRTEERTIRGIVESSPHGVLAIGGGAIENPKTRDLLHRVASVIWLHAAPEQLWERVNGSSRPLATDEAQFLRRYSRREQLYRETAHVEVDALMPFESVAAAVLNVASGGADAGRVG